MLQHVQVTIPENGQSFALIYSIEDPADPRSPVGGVGAQVMGPDDGYICQVGQGARWPVCEQKKDPAVMCPGTG